MRTTTYYDPYDVPFNDSKKILIQIFSTETDIDNIVKPALKIIQSQMPNAVITGSSSEVLIDDKSNLITAGMVIMVTEMDQSFAEGVAIKQDEKFSKTLKTKLNFLNRKRIEQKALIVLATTNVNGDDVLDVVAESDMETMISGGIAVEVGEQNKKFSYVISNEGVFKNAVVAVMLYGKNLNVSNAVETNWTPLGNKFVATKTEKNRVYELNGKPIKKVYEQYLGTEFMDACKEDITIALHYPLVMKRDNKICRAIVKKEEDCFVFSGNIEEGSEVYFGFGDMNFSAENNIYTREEIASAQSIFIYSCISRYLLAENSISHEIKDFSKIADTGGMFTYGEFFCKKCSSQEEWKAEKRYSNDKGNIFLNQTLTILALRETGNKKKSNDTYTLETQEDESGGSFSKNKKNILRKATHNFIKAVTNDVELYTHETEDNIKEINKLSRALNDLGANCVPEVIMESHSNNIDAALLLAERTAKAIDFKSHMHTLKEEDILRMQQTISLFLTEAKISINSFRDYNNLKSKISLFSIENTIEKAYKILEHYFVENNITVEPIFIRDKEANANLLIKSNEKALLSMLVYLMSNSVKAVAEKNENNGKITLTVTQNKQNYVLEVQDNRKYEEYSQEEAESVWIKACVKEELRGQYSQTAELWGTTTTIKIPL